MRDLRELVETTRLASSEVADRARHVYDTVLETSPNLDAGNFRRIGEDDLRRLFDLYDRGFFGGDCRRCLGASRLDFRLSRRMTKTAGTTTRFTSRRGGEPPRYEIAVSTTLLAHAFREGDRPIAVCGIGCGDRLEALQRVFEHELVHLVEMLVWTKSSCRAARFRSIAGNVFGHTAFGHALITPQERAFVQHGIRPGIRVRFRLDGAEHVGVVNRVTKRATVLVEDRHGPRYSDGKRYAKFYVPVAMLEPVSPR